MAKSKLILPAAILIGAGAMYPYSFDLMSKFDRVDRYGNPYSLAKAVGKGLEKRIIVPRAMATIGPETKDFRSEGLDVEFTSHFKARNEKQTRFIDATVSYLRAGKSLVSEAPTGFGKTVCGCEIIGQVGKKALIVVTKTDIRDQWVTALKMVLGLTDKDIGFIQGDTCQISGRKVCIAMVQSLAKEDRYSQALLDEFGFVTWDEVHRVGADYFSQSGFRVRAALRWGVSATPDRKDGRSSVIEAHIGPVLVREEAMNMIPRVIARSSAWKVPMVRRTDKITGKSVVVPMPHVAGRCAAIVKLLSEDHERNMIIARFVKAAYDKGRYILIQSDRKEHLDVLQGLINTVGVPLPKMGWYVGGMKKEELEYTKTLPVCLATFQMTKEATDNPRWDTLVMATPKSDIVQIAGRVLRELEGKDPVIFDIVDGSSPVFLGYWNSRKRWYTKIGAPIDV